LPATGYCGTNPAREILLVLSERQFVNRADLEVIRAVARHHRIIEVIVLRNGNFRLPISLCVAAESHPLRPGITCKKLEPVAESLLDLGLQGLVVHVLKGQYDDFLRRDSKLLVQGLTRLTSSRQTMTL
jgi:hypothetical protein